MLVLAVGLANAIAGIVAAVVSLFHQPKPRYPSQLWVRNTGDPWVEALEAPRKRELLEAALAALGFLGLVVVALENRGPFGY